MELIHHKLEPGLASITGYLHRKSEEMPQRDVRPCILVCPGGGYEFLSDRENEPIALTFLSAGYQVFILTYSVMENAGGLRPLTEISQAVMALREHADEWRIQADAIAVMGFSAGGHVAASLGVHWDSPELKAVLDTQGGLNRPNAMVLCYPVITGGPQAHRISLDWVTGGDASKLDFFSLETWVDEKTPPAFLWHTFTDPAVPVQNTLLMASALAGAGVPFECHVFPEGRHGLALSREETNIVNIRCQEWVPMCMRWLGDVLRFAY